MRRRGFEILAVLMASGSCLVQAQGSCPVSVVAVYSPKAATSELPTANGAFQVKYRNTSEYPIETVVFRAEFRPSWPYANRSLDLIARRPLAAGAANTEEWNIGRSGLGGSQPLEVLLKPKIVVFGDGSTWSAELVDQCGFDGPVANSAPEAQPVIHHGTSDADTGVIVESQATLSRSGEDIIAAGKGSLCRLTSTPAGATIDVDGRVIGTTPLRFILLARPRPRDLFVYEAGYDLFHEGISPDGHPITIDVLLHGESESK